MIIMQRVDIEQKIVNVLFALFGGRDFIIQLQVDINAARHENDNPDKSKLIMTDEFGNWLQ